MENETRITRANSELIVKTSETLQNIKNLETQRIAEEKKALKNVQSILSRIVRLESVAASVIKKSFGLSYFFFLDSKIKQKAPNFDFTIEQALNSDSRLKWLTQGRPPMSFKTTEDEELFFYSLSLSIDSDYLSIRWRETSISYRKSFKLLRIPLEVFSYSDRDIARLVKKVIKKFKNKERKVREGLKTQKEIQDKKALERKIARTKSELEKLLKLQEESAK